MDAPESSPNPPRLLDQVRTAIRLRGMSYRTEQAYVDWIRRYILFHQKRHPSELGPAEIRAFLAHLVNDSNVAPSTQNQALHSILFLYRRVLFLELPPISGIQPAKKEPRLLVVFTRREVESILGELKSVKRLMVSLLYGSGLRLSELLACELKISTSRRVRSSFDKARAAKIA